MRIEETAFHPLRRVIIGLQPHCRKGKFARGIHVGMRHIDTAVEYGRFAEDYVFCPGLIMFQQIFDSLKPNKINNPRSIREMTDKPALSSFAKSLKTEDFTFQLNVRHITVYFMNIVKTAPVYIFIREIVQQITQGKNIQLLVQDCCTLGPHPLQIFYVTRSDIEHFKLRLPLFSNRMELLI